MALNANNGGSDDVQTVKQLPAPRPNTTGPQNSEYSTDRSNNGGTEAINGLIELHRRLARGYRNRDNYRLRMLLIAGGLRT
ncbi:transposase [Dietzia cercidiphylli]|uniref:transposase n=1 Tax=Dietzia TaxID=37914 RepID=UPI001F49CC6F|nr:transposase [Dietzia sp. KRD202]